MKNKKIPAKFNRVYSKQHKRKGTVVSIIDYSTPSVPMDIKVIFDYWGPEYCHLNDLTILDEESENTLNAVLTIYKP